MTIRPGTIEELTNPEGLWIILDIGFANKRKSCGIAIGDESTVKVTFNQALIDIIRAISENPITNLVIEAPLSVAFDKFGNPTARRGEKKNNNNRYWYVGPGCAVMVAAMYLMKELIISNPSGEVRLFEGFVSYKNKKSDHIEDVKILKQAIEKTKKDIEHIIQPNSLRILETDEIRSAFYILGYDIGIPPVITGQS